MLRQSGRLPLSRLSAVHLDRWTHYSNNSRAGSVGDIYFMLAHLVSTTRCEGRASARYYRSNTAIVDGIRRWCSWQQAPSAQQQQRLSERLRQAAAVSAARVPRDLRRDMSCATIGAGGNQEGRYRSSYPTREHSPNSTSNASKRARGSTTPRRGPKRQIEGEVRPWPQTERSWGSGINSDGSGWSYSTNEVSEAEYRIKRRQKIARIKEVVLVRNSLE